MMILNMYYCIVADSYGFVTMSFNLSGLNSRGDEAFGKLFR